MPFPLLPKWDLTATPPPGSMYDPFTGTDGDFTTSARTALNWVAIGSSAGTITSNQMTGSSASALDVFRCSTSVGWPHQQAEITITTLSAVSDRSAGVWLRMDTGTAKSGYQVEINQLNNRFSVTRWIAGSGASLSGGFGPLPETLALPCTLGAEVVGTTITVFINGEQIWQGDDTDATLSNNTYVGINTYNSNGFVRIDSFAAGSAGNLTLPAPEVLTFTTQGTGALFTARDTVPGLISRWVADDLDAVLNGGDSVASWPVSAGLETQALSASGVNAPTFDPGIISGHDAVRFTRSSLQSLATAPWAHTYGAPLTVVAVWRPATLETRMDVWSGLGATYVHGTASPARVLIGAGTADQMQGSRTITPAWHVTAAVYDGASSQLYEDARTPTNTGTTSTATTVPQAALGGMHVGANSSGAGAYLDGWVAELLVINRAVGSAELSIILGDLATSYGLTWAPTSSGIPSTPPVGSGGGQPGLPVPTPVPGAPIPHIGIVFDEGPLSPITLPLTDDIAQYSTFGTPSVDNLIGFAAGTDTTITIATDYNYALAGSASLAVTRKAGTGTGLASYFLTMRIPQGEDWSGRTFLLWVPIRPGLGAQNRTVRVSMSWRAQDGTQLAFTLAEQAEGAGYVSANGHTWIGVLSTCPTPQPYYWQYSVAVVGAAAGETHHVDGWTIRYFGVDVSGRLRDRPGETRGRADDLQNFEAGSGSLVLANNDGLLTPGGSGYPVDLRNQITFLWEFESILYPNFVGYATEWVNDAYTDDIGDVRVSYADVFDLLTSTKLRGPYQSEVLKTDPVGYLPMSEDEGSKSAGNIAGGGGYGVIVSAQGAEGGSAFGGQSFQPLGNQGHTIDSDVTCLDLNPELATARGDCLDVSSVPGALPDGTKPWAMQMRFAIRPMDTIGILWRNSVSTVQDLLTGFQIEMDGSTGHLRVYAWTSPTAITKIWENTLFTADADSPYSITIIYRPAVGTTPRAVRISFGNVDTTINLPFDPFVGPPDRAFIGGAYSGTRRVVDAPTSGRFSHLALWNEKSKIPGVNAWSLTAVREPLYGLEAYISGAVSAGTEDGRLFAMVGYAGTGIAYSRLDHGLTLLLDPYWGDRSSALSAMQSVAANAAAALMTSADGRVMLRNRLARAQATPKVSFKGALAPSFGSASPRLDRARLANVVTIKRTLGAQFRLVDEQSRDKYGEVEIDSTIELAIASDSETMQYGQAVLRSRAIPAPEIRTLTFRPRGNAALIRTLLNTDIGDFIRAGDLPVPTMHAVEVSGWVEQISSRSDGALADMEWTLALSPATSPLVYGEIPNVTPPPAPGDGGSSGTPAGDANLSIRPVANIGATTSTLRMGTRTGPQMYLAGATVWGIEDTIVNGGFGEGQYNNRTTICNTIKTWGGNVIRLRVLADDYDKAAPLTKAQILTRVKGWRDAARGAGILLMICWWDALDGDYSDAAWGTSNNHRRSFQMMTDVYTALGNDGYVLYEPFNEPNNVSAAVWDTAMRETMAHFRNTLGYTGLLVIDTITWSHQYDDTRMTGLEAYDATLTGMGGFANIAFARHDYSNDYSGATWSNATWTAANGGSSRRHLIFETEFGNYNGPGTTNATWSGAAASFFASQMHAQDNLIGACAFVYGPWYDANAITTANNVAPTAWGVQVRDNFLANAAATAITSTAPSTPPPAGSFWPSSGSADTNKQSEVDRWGTWRGRPCTLALCYTTRSAGWNAFMPSSGQPAFYKNPNYRLVLQTSPFPTNVNATYAALIAGNYDSQWRQFAASLKTLDESVGRMPTILSIAWEANGSYFTWGYGNGVSQYPNATVYKTAFQHIVNIVRSVYPAVKIAWVTNGHGNPMPASQIYPGDGYVDYLGTDYYDHYPATKTRSAFDAEANKADAGIRWYLKMARDHGKKLILPEWGVTWSTSNGQLVGGGDNPDWISWMFEVFQDAHSTGHMGGECYFDDPMGGGNVDSDLVNNGNPKSAARYVALY